MTQIASPTLKAPFPYFGGKWWSRENRVSYYSEDQTPELDRLKDALNGSLSRLAEKYAGES